MTSSVLLPPPFCLVKQVEIPQELKAEMYPHYMERGNKYNSKSVLGLIYDRVQSSQTETVSAEGVHSSMYRFF